MTYLNEGELNLHPDKTPLRFLSRRTRDPRVSGQVGLIHNVSLGIRRFRTSIRRLMSEPARKLKLAHLWPPQLAVVLQPLHRQIIRTRSGKIIDRAIEAMLARSMDILTLRVTETSEVILTITRAIPIQDLQALIAALTALVGARNILGTLEASPPLENVVKAAPSVFVEAIVVLEETVMDMLMDNTLTMGTLTATTKILPRTLIQSLHPLTRGLNHRLSNRASIVIRSSSREIIAMDLDHSRYLLRSFIMATVKEWWAGLNNYLPSKLR